MHFTEDVDDFILNLCTNREIKWLRMSGGSCSKNKYEKFINILAKNL